MALVLLSGCATTEYPIIVDAVDHKVEVAKEKTITPKTKGVLHKIAKGQTLWRIAKIYGVSVDDLIQSNNIPNAAAVEVDQLILIPGAMEVRDIPVKTVDEKSQEFAWPIKGRVTSFFNDRKGDSLNRGVDIEAEVGDAVKAVREGHVVLADYVPGYGQMICVDHGDSFMSVYSHNQKILAKLGDRVYKGDVVAEVGRVGRRSLAHFELRKGTQAVNPLYYLP